MKQSVVFTMLLFLLLPCTSLAAQFDVWDTGITLEQVVEVARQNNIPLRRSGIIAADKGFNKRFIDEQFWKATSVGYVTNLLGVNAKVELLISPEWPQRLYEIQVKFTDTQAASKQFKESLLNMLSDKYGSPQNASRLLHKAYLWEPKDNDQILLTLLSFPILSYADAQLKAHVEEQRGYKAQDKKKGYIKRDAGKF